MNFSELLKTTDSQKKLVCEYDESILTSESIGNLIVTSGKIVACDPFCFPDTPPFDILLKPGDYPVLLTRAKRQDKEHFTNAFAMLYLSQDMPVEWKRADTYPIDSGTGCFIDANVAQAVMQSVLESETDAETLSWALVEEFEKKDNPGWVNLTIDKTSGANIIAFDSGLGDGYYNSYFGYDANNNVTHIVTQFLSGEIVD